MEYSDGDDPGAGEQDSSADVTPIEAKFVDAGVGTIAGVAGFGSMLLFWGPLIGLLAFTVVDGELTDLHFLILNPFVLGPGMLTGTVAYLVLSKHDLEFIDLSIPTLRDLGHVVLGIAALLSVAYAVDVLLGYFQVSAAEHGTVETARQADPAVLLYLIATSVLIIGPAEELLFRNVVQKRLYDSFSRYGAIGFASVVFAIVHFEAYRTGSIEQILASLVTVLTLSLLLGWIYHRTENLVVPAIVHGVYNAFVFGSVYYEEVAAVLGSV